MSDTAVQAPEDATDAAAPTADARARRRIAALLLAAAVLVIAYWIVWFVDRSVLASEHQSAYYQFENAFPLADGWLALCLIAGAWTLVRRRATALLWLLCGAGAGLYLFGMDVLYDLEHGIWAKGGGGAVELAINMLTLAVGLGVLRWTWRRRAVLMAVDPPRVGR